MIGVIDPRGMDAREWTDRSSNALVSLVPILKIRSGDEWREWGSHVRQVLTRRGILTPDPEQFNDWREWAMRLNQVISQI